MKSWEPDYIFGAAGSRCLQPAPRGGRANRRALAVGFLCLAVSGCASGIHTPSSIPPQYVAQPVENMASIQLSRLSNAAIGSETIDHGDVLEVTLATDSSEVQPTKSLVRVDEDGNANVPMVGLVAVVGLEPTKAETAIALASVQRGVFRNPHVTATINRQRKNHVTVIGAVKTPGVFELPRGASSLLAALVAAGGLTPEAAPTVEIRQPSSGLLSQGMPKSAGEVKLASHQEAALPAATSRVNLLEPEAQPGAGSYLHDGAVVVVAKRDPRRIHVIGLVRKPGQYELPPDQDLFLLDALAMAGGRTMELADKVLLIRHPVDGQAVRVEISVKQAKKSVVDNMRLSAGDVVSVEQTPTTALVEAVRTFLHFGIGATVPMF